MDLHSNWWLRLTGEEIRRFFDFLFMIFSNFHFLTTALNTFSFLLGWLKINLNKKTYLLYLRAIRVHGVYWHYCQTVQIFLVKFRSKLFKLQFELVWNLSFNLLWALPDVGRLLWGWILLWGCPDYSPF